jgi:glycosyltransferase involved in cell wall biosynthesis
MVMIARDEERHVHECFSRFWEGVDQVVLCDTGSTDRTIARARRFARDRGEKDKLVIGRFAWCDDFSAARNHADSLAAGRVLIYCDLDDRVEGAENLRAVSRKLLAQGQCGLFARYLLQGGPPAWPHRIAVAGATHWVNPVWERREPDSPSATWGHVSPRLCQWRHARDTPKDTRDLRLTKRWAEENPDVPTPWLCLGFDHAANEEPQRAREAYMRYLSFPGLRSELRAYAHARAAVASRTCGDWADAKESLLRAIEERPRYAFAWVYLAESCLRLGELEEALDWASRVLASGSRPLNAEIHGRDPDQVLSMAEMIATIASHELGNANVPARAVAAGAVAVRKRIVEREEDETPSIAVY